MTDTPHDEPVAGSESREGKQARRHKAHIANILGELVEALEDARKDGFLTEFMLTRDNAPDSPYRLGPDYPTLIKRW